MKRVDTGMRNKPTEAGFTLLEVLVVIACVLILAALILIVKS